MDVYPDEESLATALRAGHHADSLPLVQKLQSDDRVILTPHNAFNTETAVERKAQQSVDAVALFLQTQTFPEPIPVG